MNFISMIKLPFFQKGDSKGIRFFSTNSQLVENVFFIYIAVIFLFFIVLFLRLFQLTVVKGSYYRNLSEQNRVREINIEAPRGEIVDRKGFVIAQNLNPDINQKTITSKRIYQNPEVIAHFVGYRQTADVNDLKSDRCPYKLQLGDRTGKKGIEKLFDCQLRGRPGKKLIEVDAKGKYLKTINVIPPRSGDKIQLSLDLSLQKKSYELIKDKKAAIVAVNPKTGEILVSVSTPSFNSQNFEDQIDSNIQKYLTDKDSPLFNRVTEGVYPPGSLFKLVVAAAGLEEKIIDEKTQIEDTGTIKAGPLTFGNWYFLQYGKTDGMVDVIKALKRSNDIFFYKIGEKIGADKIKKWSDIFGLGKYTGIGIDEVEGSVPSSFWKKEVLKENWYLGDTYNLSIGQGYIETTPLQTVLITGVFANEGYLCQPQLLKSQRSKVKNQSCKKLSISQKTLSLIREGMRQTCSTGGTGWPLFNLKAQRSKIKDEEIQTACKTGTAESHAKSGLPHAWITVFAPYDNPEIALTVLIEEGGQGSDAAGPVAKEILKAYFERSE